MNHRDTDPAFGSAAAGSGAVEAPEAGEPTPFLATAFYVGGALCALDAALVEEIVRLRRTTAIPHAPPYLMGVMNLRGKIVSVIDLARKLGMPATQPTDESRVYIIRDRSELVGVLVDRSADVIELNGPALTPPPANVRGVEAGFVRGIGRAGERLAAVLDPAAVLSAEGQPRGAVYEGSNSDCR